MPGDMKLADFKRKFEKYGVRVFPGSKHWKMEKEIDGRLVVYVFATKSGRHVARVYVDKARKRFKLTPDDGVSNKEFNSA